MNPTNLRQLALLLILTVVMAWPTGMRLHAAQATPTPAAQKKDKPVVHALSGTVEAVDSTAKTISVKTADGTVEVVKVTDHTTVTGLKAGAKYTDLAASKSAHVVVHYTGEGADKTATGVESFGEGTEKVLKGTVVDVDHAAKTMSIKTADGTVEVVKMSDHATVETSKGVAKGVEKGSEVTVHYTESAGRKIGHFFKKL